MAHYAVRESPPLRGEIPISTSKNAVLPIMCGALLTGVLSDVFTLSTSMLLITGSYLVSAVCFWAASHTYEKDLATVKHVTVRF